MCYDISFKTDIEMLSDYFPGLVIDAQIELDFEMTVHRQAQSYQKAPVVMRQDNTFYVKNFEWGLIASYMKTNEQVKKSRSFMCNARAEKILDKASYWYKIKHQRCLLPVIGIYEHRSVTGIKNKIPYHVRWRDRKMFCIPGFYNYSPIPDVETGELAGTYTIITTAANQLMKYIHNDGENKHRMPLFLPKELELEWLKPDLSDQEMQEILNFQAASEDLESWTVSTIRTTKERPDGKLKNEPFNWPNLPPLGEEGSQQKTLF
ncbi:MAG TPA: SOS response-associated peptidase family protein [Ferruginibacter sp.]|nr:SOS response-associated peptidase family protein [Ferruginibacter sp.]